MVGGRVANARGDGVSCRRGEDGDVVYENGVGAVGGGRWMNVRSPSGRGWCKTFGSEVSGSGAR